MQRKKQAMHTLRQHQSTWLSIQSIEHQCSFTSKRLPIGTHLSQSKDKILKHSSDALAHSHFSALLPCFICTSRSTLSCTSSCTVQEHIRVVALLVHVPPQCLTTFISVHGCGYLRPHLSICHMPTRVPTELTAAGNMAISSAVLLSLKPASSRMAGV